MPLHSKYISNLSEAKDFEDFAFDTLMHERRLVVGGYKSRHYQVMYGESLTGVEVKYDRKFRQTGNLYIETAESANDFDSRKPAGIYHRSDPWLFVIGDYETIWAIAVSSLRNEHAVMPPKFRSVETSTSSGFLLPQSEADRIAAFRWEA